MFCATLDVVNVSLEGGPIDERLLFFVAAMIFVASGANAAEATTLVDPVV